MRLFLSVTITVLLATGAGAAGRASICDIQEYDAQGLSPLIGESVTVRGVVTCPPGYFLPEYTSFYIESDGCGVNVFTYYPPPLNLALGDSVEVSGEVHEYITSFSGAGAVTQIFSVNLEVVLLSTGHPAPVPAEVTVAALNMEENEGRLLSTIGVVTGVYFPYGFYISDGTGEVEVYRGAPDSVSFAGIAVGDTLRVTGVLSQYDRTVPYFSDYEFMPRTTRDIEEYSMTPVRQSSWGTIKAMFR